MKNRNSGLYDPNADRKNRIPATKRDLLRPRVDAKKPDKALPRIQPINALDEVMPCIVSVY